VVTVLLEIIIGGVLAAAGVSVIGDLIATGHRPVEAADARTAARPSTREIDELR
jgi:hypothetical protein